jgi:hypothetical protein
MFFANVFEIDRVCRRPDQNRTRGTFIMKSATKCSLFISGFIFVFGCNPAGESTNSSQLHLQEKTQIAKVNAETKSEQARFANREYAFAQREEYINGLKVELQEIQRDYDKVMASVESAGDARKEELKDGIVKMQLQLDAAKENLNKAGNATEDNWDAVKSDIRSSWNNLQDSLDQSREWLSEKISP